MGHQLTAIVALFFITVVTCDECDYKKFTPDHTACISRNPNCDILDNQVTDDDKNMILDLHNRYREKVAIGKETFWPERGGLPTASNMLEMEWDDELATVAQRRAETCEFKYDCDDCLKVDRFDVGQNLYRSWISESSSKDLWERMMKTFYNEVKNFNKEYVSSFKFQADYGRFSQLIWADSWRVGCGKVVYKDGKWDKTLVSCNYGPR
ncbi:CRISP/Allergen/PR-1 [Araneus ventricosus]|uniref:CRISP/Allergen/PR-1 n=1 Tax=Araneus ventricosus TaxID=182803 RepID=A0A4Y2SXB3_ARAVE|nr:CRISP/Allergen/PR-1 [Araneus ventricosus]